MTALVLAVLAASHAIVPFSRIAALGAAHEQAAGPGHGVLGFDLNDYPGDAALADLRRRFAFSGYWLNATPRASTNSWAGKRELVRAQGFGFLILFNGRTEKEIRRGGNAAALGTGDGADAVAAAHREGFHPGSVIFLDQEEGGRMLDIQRSYIHAWVDAVNGDHFRAGIYCSGMPAREEGGVTVVTADDIRANAGGRAIAFFVYNDACPPSPGCVYPANPPAPSASGVAFAAVWQFAQTPRRPEFTRACAATYAANGECRAAPASEAERAAESFIDLDVADSADPSHGRD